MPTNVQNFWNGLKDKFPLKKRPRILKEGEIATDEVGHEHFMKVMEFFASGVLQQLEEAYEADKSEGQPQFKLGATILPSGISVLMGPLIGWCNISSVI